MTDSSNDQTRPACPACGARLDASYEPGDPCPHCEDGTLVALPEVMESDLAQQSDVAGPGSADGMDGLDEFSSPPDFSGGLGDQDTTTRSQSLPARGASVGEEETATGDKPEGGSATTDNAFDRWEESSTAENPSLPDMQAAGSGASDVAPPDDLPSAEGEGESGESSLESEEREESVESKSEQNTDDAEAGGEPEPTSKSGGFVPPPSSVVEEMPEEEDDEPHSDRQSGLARESSAPAPQLPDEEGGEEMDREAADRSGELESALAPETPHEGTDSGERPSAEELLEEQEEWPKDQPTSDQSNEASAGSQTGPPSRPSDHSRSADQQHQPGPESPPTTPSDPSDQAESTGRAPATTESRDERESSGLWLWAIGGMLGLAGIGVGVVVATGIVNLGINDGQSASKAANDPDRIMEARAEAVRQAASLVDEAAVVDTEDAKLRRNIADRLAQAGRAADASRIQDAMWRNGSRSRDFTVSYLDLLIEAERYHRARMVALAGARLHEQTDPFRDRYEQSLEADAMLGATEPVEVGAEIDVASLSRARDIDADGLSLKTVGGRRLVFYPETSQQRAWRNHVAAWRLCEVLGCGFEIPWTRKARLTKQRFKEVAGGELSPTGGLYDEESSENRIDSFHWQSPSGTDTEYLYGALRSWPGQMARWPIEAFEIWRPWMRASRPSDVLDTSAVDAWSEFSETLDDNQIRRLRDEARQQTLRSVAAQLSDVLVFDYLTNNWGRFAPDSATYGVNNHFRDGRFVTVDTDQTFQRRHSRRVKGRFSWTEIFREETVFALRWVGRDQLLGILYPNPSSLERAKFALVWEQRNRVLERIDKLVGEHGRTSVFPFSVIPLWPVGSSG